MSTRKPSSDLNGLWTISWKLSCNIRVGCGWDIIVRNVCGWEGVYVCVFVYTRVHKWSYKKCLPIYIYIYVLYINVHVHSYVHVHACVLLSDCCRMRDCVLPGISPTQKGVSPPTLYLKVQHKVCSLLLLLRRQDLYKLVGIKVVLLHFEGKVGTTQAEW